MSRHESFNRRLDRVEARLKAQRSLPAPSPVPPSHPSTSPPPPLVAPPSPSPPAPPWTPPRPRSLRDYDRFASEAGYEEEVRRSAALPEGPFADRYKFNPYALAFMLKYGMATLKASGRLSDADLHALAEAGATIIDHVFAAEFGDVAFSNPNAVHFPNLGI